MDANNVNIEVGSIWNGVRGCSIEGKTIIVLDIINSKVVYRYRNRPGGTKIRELPIFLNSFEKIDIIITDNTPLFEDFDL